MNKPFKPTTVESGNMVGRLQLVHHMNMICLQLQQLCHFMCTANDIFVC